MEGKVSGPDPGYVSCSRFVAQAAYSVLKHGPRFEKMHFFGIESDFIFFISFVF